ncbi:MAG: hypothetical protein ABEJ24_03020 [Candidatus Magasanikbacteria bacterium]
MQKKLNQKALETIDNFLNLEIAGIKTACPYFNNKRANIRAGLKVKVGKGSPEEIEQEVKVLAKKKGVNLKEFDESDLRKFMIDNNIAIDCSGFAYYVLNAQYQQEHEVELKKNLSFKRKSLIRIIISHFRPITNTNVKLLSDENNSKKVELRRVNPGNFISIKGYGAKNKKDHIAVINSVDYKDNSPETISCVHSFRWSSDGKYEGGVRRFKIKIDDLNSDITKQTWIEKGEENEDNETYLAASSAQKTEIRELTFF